MIFQNKKTPLEVIKKRSLKSRKIEIFPKGLTHGFYSKNGHFFKFFFQQYRPGIFFYAILEEKNAFLGYKKKKLKKSKNCHFSKEVNPWFWSKNGHFFKFFFQQYRPGIFFYAILEEKNAFLGYKKKKLKKSKNCHFSKGVNPWFWSKKKPLFPTFFFYAIQGRKMSFMII